MILVSVKIRNQHVGIITQEAYRMEQEISLVFPRSQENHPGLLSLLAECRMYARQLMREDNDVDKVP